LPVIQSSASKDRPASIVITGSKQGITNPPVGEKPAYNASKAAVKAIAEHLSFDLRSNTNISVHLLVPGWTFTGLTGGGRTSTRTKPDGAWNPAQVAEYFETHMEKGEFYIICPDGDTTEEDDQRRILWAAGDIVERRPPLSRWREDWKDKAKEEIEKISLPGK
jgi:NAD(P)-dependent dehydrogenase (short-subunit alcohol dehydrogenase family)